MAEKAFKQEMPPRGGYASINIARNLKTRGPSGFMTFVLGTGIMLGGFLVVKYGNNKRRTLKMERQEAKVSLIPLIQAEQDRNMIRQMKENMETEEAIMKHVKGWKVGESVYHNERWVTPHSTELEKL
ncbi:Hypothetical predicted protein [Paramuricea clavata]|uniref:NADH dehydrogenase [ubiquinone] 1 alpha subcomplex subunit 13 n=1 Tax=Paramuricea clavata TaxID=317549 RepID=A0A6S7HPY2_PARCT|nr:Hypothetical predicted protein [Paramuricea clavata]